MFHRNKQQFCQFLARFIRETCSSRGNSSGGDAAGNPTRGGKRGTITGGSDT